MSHFSANHDKTEDVMTDVKEDRDIHTETEEVFKDREGETPYRTVGWIKATFIFMKILFATGVLAIPSSMVALGAVGGSILIIVSGFLNPFLAIALGNFRKRHPGCHTIADMADHVGGWWMRELVGVLYIVAMVLVSGGGIIGCVTGLNLLGSNPICSVIMSLICAIVIGLMASFPKFSQIGWITWAGFASIFIAVFIVVVGVTTQDRPHAAPPGNYELGFYAIPPTPPSFALGMTSVINIWSSSAGYPAFVPVIAEMKRPQDFNKAIITCFAIVTSSYLAFSLVVYRWCGQYVANPSLSSAGDVVAKVSYGIGLFGLLASSMIYIHLGAKYLFVRLLRNSRHLQTPTVTHWVIWFSCSLGLTILAWLCAEGIPIFNYVIALSGSLCWGPMCLIFPCIFFFSEHRSYLRGTLRQKGELALYGVILCVGILFTVGGLYSTVLSIIGAYRDGTIGKAFDCNGNTVVLTS